ncbi:hypothetical protein M422DRAFT_255436 [Sphaerobolus stellatus SS14]|uniref:Fungal calcium binding protein domain-containing protein n=1 Tax=Sphaerobolus stellatus (strain SS14) TaxID=990650 RepID=A0A0C9UEV4_SPHS4|nr:hypothetical protein M422DRAFT_255436 [Sphaerobolus stellatus SS14]
MVSFKLSALFVGLLAVVRASVPSKRQGCDIGECLTALSTAIAGTPAAACVDDALDDLLDEFSLGAISDTATCLSGLTCISGGIPTECTACASILMLNASACT